MPSKIITRVLLALAGLALVGLSSCAYQQTMDERNAENYHLRKELDAENARGEDLRH